MFTYIKYYLFFLPIYSILLCNNAVANTPNSEDKTNFEIIISDSVLCPDSSAVLTIIMPGVENGFFSYTHLGFAYSKSLTNGIRTFSISERGEYTITSYGEIANDGSITSITHTDISFSITNHRLPNAFVSGGGTFCRFNTVTPLIVNLTGEAPWTLRYNLNNSETIEESYTNTPVTIADVNSANIDLISLSDKNCRTSVSGSGSLEVIETPNADLIGDTVLCSNSIANYLIKYDPDYKYTWNLPEGVTSINQNTDQPNTTTIKWNKPGVYKINYEVTSFKNNCSTGTLSKSILIHSLPEVKNNYDTIVCFSHKDYVNLIATDSPTNSVFWLETETHEHPLQITDTGEYWYVESIPFGCSDTGSIRVHEKCMPEVFVPEAFTPNNDGINDLLYIFGNYFNLTLEIYTANGQLIHIYEQNAYPWDGTVDGNEVMNGVYYWKANFTGEFGKPYYNEGKFTLIR